MSVLYTIIQKLSNIVSGITDRQKMYMNSPVNAGEDGQVLTNTSNGIAWVTMDVISSVNGKTGYNVLLTAQDVNAVSISGKFIIPVTANNSNVVISPQNQRIYKYQAIQGDRIQINTSLLTEDHALTFQVWIYQGSNGVNIVLPNNVIWGDGTVFGSSQPVPSVEEGNNIYCLVFRWNGERLLGNLAYIQNIE